MAKAYLLEDKVAIVTGAGAGIGYAVASEFSKEGAKVVIAELRPEKGAEAAKKISSSTGKEVICIPTDVRKEEDILNMIAQTLKRFKKN
jgi:NADP-dependent 3-hydroxy acid dehydrogenase YdfG